MARSVLVVDDDASFRALAAGFLRAWGQEVAGEGPPLTPFATVACSDSRRGRPPRRRHSPVADFIGEALYHAERANTELRDLVHGILPVSLSSRGLRIGLESLIGDLAFPVHLHMTAPRLPPEIETPAYFFVAEALTNVAKHAHATHANVAVELDGQTLSLEVRDNGGGGADPRHGTGLVGLSDRVEAANGTLTISSTTSSTTLRARLPMTGN